MFELSLPLLKWCVWDAELAAAAGQVLPPLDFIEPMMRRRLSPLAKMSLWAAHECARDYPDVRMIYASQHGEVMRTAEMLGDLADNTPLSPTAFSMSVLNANLGLYSISQHNHAPATAIAAGANSFAAGLIEAGGQLARYPQASVLLVYADDAVPEILREETGVQAGAYTLALLFGALGTKKIFMRPQADGEPSPLSQARSFARGLAEGQDASGGGWCWTFA